MANLYLRPAWAKNARWIWVPDYDDSANEAGFVLFRKTFSLSEKAPEPCTVHVSADTRYRLFVNGQSVSFGPCKSYADAWTYESVDLAPYCVKGDNVISARVLRYSPVYAGNSSMMRSKYPGFLVQGTVVVSCVFV